MTIRSFAAPLVVGLAIAALYLLMPEGSVAQGGIFIGASIAVVLVVGRSARRSTGRVKQAWKVLFLSEILYLLGNVALFATTLGLPSPGPFPSPADGLFLISYLGFGAFMLLLLPRGERKSFGWGAILDALIVATAVASLVQPFLIEPLLSAGSSATWEMVVAIAYPAALISLLVIGLQTLFRGGLRSAWGILVILWLVFELIPCVNYLVTSIDGRFQFRSPLVALLLVSYAAIVGAAMAAPTTLPKSVPSRTGIPIRRLTILSLAVAIPIAAFLVAPEPSHPRVFWISVAIVLLMLRVRSLVGDVRLEQDLRKRLALLNADLEHAAMHDPLTGSLNRQGFERAFTAVMEDPDAGERGVGILSIDLHSFKAVNDRHGHWAGDQVLRRLSERLVEGAGPEGKVARIDGDEFGILLEGVTEEEAVATAHRVLGLVVAPTRVAEVDVTLAASVGVVIARDGDPLEDSFKRADVAMYAAKALGGGVRLFDPDSHRRMLDERRLILDLREAPRMDQLVLHYQPLIDLKDRSIVGAEALLRWQHPTRGLLGPFAFMDLAETSGAIVEVGQWVLRQACRDAKGWVGRCPDRRSVGISINVSRRQLTSPSLVDDVWAAITDADLDPELVTLEITETALMSDTDGFVRVLESLKALGVSIAMDDFGIGYSSLSQLRGLPIDVLKVDRAFVSGIAHEDDEWALASAILKLAGSLGKKTLGEGIETASQLAHLRSMGCPLGQGFLFAKPMPLHEFEELLASGERLGSGERAAGQLGV